ncbi:Uncharacterised protein [uncultured archaeon]|nr:Uncharacterised protein [uncultured archaeon]
MVWFEHSSSSAAISGPRPVFTIFLLFALLLPLARADLLYNGSPYSPPPSLNSVPLNMSCRPFWTDPLWRSNWIVYSLPSASGSPLPYHVYHMDSLQAPQSLGIGQWAPGSVSTSYVQAPNDSDAAAALASARQQAAQAQQAYGDLAGQKDQLLLDIQLHRFSDCFGAVITGSESPLCIQSQGAAFFSSVVEYITGGRYRYTPIWNEAMRSSTTALSSASSASSGAFAQAQSEADELARAGAADPAYTGPARSAWQDWYSFSSTALSYSSGASRALSLPSSDLSAQPALRYARAYRVLHQVESACANPSDPILFNRSGSPAVVFNDLAAEDNTLLQLAESWRARLSQARAQMNYESAEAQSGALSTLSDAGSMMAAVRRAGWSDAYGLPSRPVSELADSGSQWDRLGTYSARLAQAEDSLAQANASAFSAAQLRESKPVFWQSQAILRERSAVQSAQLSASVSSRLLEDMNQSARSEYGQALAAVESLNLSLQSSPSGANAKSVQAAYSALANASAELQAGQSAGPAALGSQYAHYAAALSQAQLGAQLLADPSQPLPNPSPGDRAEYRRLLDDFSRRIGWAQVLGVDTSDFNASWSNFFSKLAEPAPLDGAMDALRLQIAALNSQMDEKLASEDSKFRELESATQSLLPYSDSSLLQKWRAESSVWRQPSGAWSDKAYQNPIGLRNQLDESAQRIHQALGRTLSQTLCQSPQTQWLPHRLRPAAADERVDVGGLWSTSNPLPLDYNDSLDLACPLAVSFLPPELDNKSANVQSVWSSDGALNLRLSSIPAHGEASVEFTSWQQPNALSLKSCQLLLDPNGLQWTSNYQLRTLYSAPQVEARLPWLADLPLSSATLSGLGLTLQGQPASDDLSSVSFTLPSPPISSNWSADLRSNYGLPMRRMGVSATALDSGAVQVQYTLSLSGLPPCSSAVIQQSETADPISALSVSSPDSGSAITLVRAPAAGDPTWAARASPLPSSGSLNLAVRYQIADPAQWVGLTLPALATQARVQNDSAARGLISEANASAQISDWPMAVYKLQQAKAQLLKSTPAPPDNSSAAPLDWNSTRLPAQATLDALSNLTGRLRGSAQRPAWATDVIGWRGSLNSSLDAALSSSNPTAAQIRAVRSDRDQITAKSLDLADSDYASLTKTVNAWRAITPDNSEVQGRLFELDQHLLLARNAMQSEDGLLALSELLSAHESADAYQSALSQSLAWQANQQSESVHRLADQFSLTQSQLSHYLESLQQLNSAGVHAFQPPLTLSAASTLSDQLTRSAQSLPASDTGALPADISQALKQLASRQLQLDSANQTLARAKPSVDGAQKALEQGAQERERMVQAYLGQLRLHPALASSPSMATLEADAANMEAMMDQQKWPDAIVAGESIVTRAKKLLDSDTVNPSAEPPYVLLILTAALIVGIAYVLPKT